MSSNESFFLPPLIDTLRLNPLERLRVYDSLMIDAERWRKAHDYHRERQNIHYQSLNQSGIVCGLGVKRITPPKEVSAQFRLQPWLKIQPGVAIDWEGNPIIVPQAIDFPLRLPKNAEEEIEPINLYLVVSYRDPENLNRKNTGEVIQETFRLDQKTSVPIKGEVELCRIKWQPSATKINAPKNVFFPQINEIDLRYRSPVKERVRGTINIFTKDIAVQSQENLTHLLASVSALYPAFQGAKEPRLTTLRNIRNLTSCDLFFLFSDGIDKLDSGEITVLQDYLQKGGIILIEESKNYGIDRVGNLIARKFSFDPLTWQTKLGKNHPLRTQPFLFAGLPEIQRHPIEVWYHEQGLVLIEGELSAAWGFDEELMLSREEIRAAQEFGINLLRFGWYRRKLTQLLW